MGGFHSPIWKLDSKSFADLVDKCETYREILRFFGLRNHGSNCQTLKRRFHKENIDYSKFRNPKNTKRQFPRKSPCDKIPTEELLVQGSNYNRSHLKKRLIEEGYLENKCCICGQLPFWNDKYLIMILDHINGVGNDNRIENLRLICPNCNTQTDTFAGRNKRTINNCSICGKVVKMKHKSCRSCSAKLPREYSRKVTRPSKEELKKMLWEIPTTKIAERYGVSDKAVSKWAKTYDLEKPPRGFWAQMKVE